MHVFETCSVILFSNDAATTEIYTYWNTLTLHDALPSYRSTAMMHQFGGGGVRFEHRTEGRQVAAQYADTAVGADRVVQGADDFVLAIDRSEEHTSELQSLMRISYAVF